MLADKDIEKVLQAIKTQIRRDFQPHWKFAAELEVAHDYDPPPAEATVLLMDSEPDRPGAVAYHDVKDNRGLAKVFVWAIKKPAGPGRGPCRTRCWR